MPYTHWASPVSRHGSIPPRSEIHRSRLPPCCLARTTRKGMSLVEHDRLPVWIPDAEFEKCYDEFCHQVSRHVYYDVTCILNIHPSIFPKRFYGRVYTTLYLMLRKSNHSTSLLLGHNMLLSTRNSQMSLLPITRKVISVS